MKIVVVGGTGMVGSKLVRRLFSDGHDVTTASLTRGVDALTGAGLERALQGADLVIDVLNSPKFDEDVATAFFERTTKNILEAGRRAGVGRHAALSIVGSDRLPSSGYFRAKNLQEMLIREAGVDYTIIRSTQFFEFVNFIVDHARADGMVRLAPTMVQPVAADDVADLMATIVTQAPQKLVEIAGPTAIRLDWFVEGYLTSQEDPTRVVTDPEARYYGARVNDSSLVPETRPLLGELTFESWLRSRIAAD